MCSETSQLNLAIFCCYSPYMFLVQMSYFLSSFIQAAESGLLKIRNVTSRSDDIIVGK